METWAHGLDVTDARDFAFAQHDLQLPRSY
jgi:hypothetical protein